MAGEVERPKTKQGLNEYEKALWKWVNVQDLDAFLQEVCCSAR
jgi:autophagy-related protein 9